MTITHQDFFCMELSRASEEQLAGTAAELTTVWLVLEVPQPWGNKALVESDLPVAVKDRLATWEKTVPGARVQFIKQSAGFAGDGIQFFVGLADDADPRLYRIPLTDYADLLEFDLAALLNRDPVFETQRTQDPLFLVCTNGKRDLCCAKWGVPIYRLMAEIAPAQVWQTTHIGGHRFAATLVCLPEAVTYGWVEADDAAPLIRAHQHGELYRLDRYRGRSTYAGAVQAAEAFLRRETGVLSLNAFRLAAHSQSGETQVSAEFVAVDTQVHHLISVDVCLSSFSNPTSCSKQSGEPVPQYALHSYSQRA